ncbi:hypothetical protein SAMD00019534_116200 [Acytostelium subglobosum LB1]|uniref:hypothetical protein n=1 Tax=Acytostelium subglobosum LB1 TaxID=1410327 RepID=UPI000644D75C|nr:hypothetical protein SAMD00019534_116200 [Acytostelium subglobosum LB1]GAM28444.1 hypothetical protein SAMD00019534_116200 [Acytostelium subglobosum LB1]|eukprot:XP_012748483.1 hypothetical protein SAMD00019534_116200 [Acytostelium subglobosum LB1]
MLNVFIRSSSSVLRSTVLRSNALYSSLRWTNISSAKITTTHQHVASYTTTTSNTNTTPPVLTKSSLYERLLDRNKALIDGITSEDRVNLSRLITLVESSREDHQQQARLIVSILLQQSKDHEVKNAGKPKSFRIGISGPPGAGKSTFIEAFGTFLTSTLKTKVAVLAIDPSSIRTGGSVLGDKTRMVELSKDPLAYVRPSSSRGTLGGITKSTSDTIVLCEAAGYEIIIVETVGVGQSEVAVDEMVDVFMLLVPPANGDELQGLKKGIVELSDIVVVNKADGELLPRARFTVAEYMSAFKMQRPKSEFWRPKVLSCSSLTGTNIDTVWQTICDFKDVMTKSGELRYRRADQKQTWMWRYIEEEMMNRLHTNKQVSQIIPFIESQVRDGNISPGLASNTIIEKFLSSASLPPSSTK